MRRGAWGRIPCGWDGKRGDSSYVGIREIDAGFFEQFVTCSTMRGGDGGHLENLE